MAKDNKKNQDHDNEKDPKLDTKKLILIIVTIVLLIAIAVMSVFLFKKNQENKDKEIAYTQLIKDISNGNVEKVEMASKSNAITVKLKDQEEEKYGTVPNTQAFIELIQERVAEGNNIELIQKKPNVIKSIAEGLISAMPIILMGVIIFMIIQMAELSDKGKVYEPGDIDDTQITFKDIAGLKEEKHEMMEIVHFLKEPKKYEEMGAKIPKGILLCGKPGTGKTLIAKAISGEAKVPFISISGSDFTEMFAGVGASRVRKLFEKARKLAPCIVFIDEVDAIGARTASSGAVESDNNQTLNQILVEMDGYEGNDGVIILAATNRPEMLDKALLRPGRFDRQIVVGLPDINDRIEILEIHSKNKKIEKGLDLRNIAEDTAGFTGAELENILNEAAIMATTKEHKKISEDDIEDAIKKVVVGLEKQNKKISEKDKKLTAYHEAGHAIVSKFLETQEDVKEISIIPRGFAGGYTLYKSGEDKFYMSKIEMEENLIGLMGGRAAEKVVLNDVSTGASNDFEVATNIAKDMVIKYGMSEQVGPISVNLEKDPYSLEVLGKRFQDEIGAEVKLILDGAYSKAEELLREHMDKLHEVAKILLEKEKITASEFDKIFEEN